MGSCHIGKNGFSFRVQQATVRMAPNSRPEEQAARSVVYFGIERRRPPVFCLTLRGEVAPAWVLPESEGFTAELLPILKERGGHHPYFVHSMAVEEAAARSPVRSDVTILLLPLSSSKKRRPYSLG